FAELFALIAVLAPQHGHGHLAEHRRRRCNRAFRGGPQREHRIPGPVQEPWKLAEQRPLLLEINTDATEEKLIGADVRLVRPGRRVQRKQDDIMTLGDELARQGIVAQTASAIHAGCSGRDGEDFHETSTPKPLHDCRGSVLDQYTPSTTEVWNRENGRTLRTPSQG